MNTPQSQDGAAKPPRLVFVDVVRGAAIIGVVIYHLIWDLRWFSFISVDVGVEPVTYIFARSLLSTFMILTGVSLVLAHPAQIRWKAFWRRFGVILGAALAISLATYIAFPEGFVYFGVLHAIAIFSLLALPFLRLPPILTLGIAAAITFAPAFYIDETLSVRHLSWIGFWRIPPYTHDLVPVFPWFGLTLAGVAMTRFLMGPDGTVAKLAAINFTGPVARFFILAGKWSLWIYLLHQLILFGLVYLAALVFHPELARREMDFVRSCTASCEISGEAGYCRRYCTCTMEQIAEDDLWGEVAVIDPTPDQSRILNEITSLCSVMAAEELPPEAIENR